VSAARPVPGTRTDQRRTATLSVVFVVLAIVTVAALVGCSQRATEAAKFVRYETLEDGTRVALVAPTAIGATVQYRARTTFEDLRPGELVSVLHVGRNWDTPQWMPEFEITARGGSE